MRTTKGKLEWFVGALALLALALFAAPAGAQYPPYTQQCIANASAGGSSDAITIPALPCALSTNLLLLTSASSNGTTTPTLQPLGLPAQVITRSGGAALQAGDIGPSGYVALLTPNGSNWILLNPANAGGGGGGSLVVGTTPVTGGTSGNCLTISSGILGNGACGGASSGGFSFQTDKLTVTATNTLSALSQSYVAGFAELVTNSGT